jgi:hypothetical protein
MQMHLYTPEVRVLYRLYIPTWTKHHIRVVRTSKWPWEHYCGQLVQYQRSLHFVRTTALKKAKLPLFTSWGV